MSSDYLIRMIKDREGKLAEIQAALTPLLEKSRALEVEINVLKEAASKIDAPLKKQSAQGKRERSLQPHWIKTLQFIGTSGRANLHQINVYITEALQMNLGVETQRSQLANYVNRGWLNRVSDGVYSLTEAGAEKCGFTAPEPNTKENVKEAPEGASEFI